MASLSRFISVCMARICLNRLTIVQIWPDRLEDMDLHSRNDVRTVRGGRISQITFESGPSPVQLVGDIILWNIGLWG